MNKIHSTLSRLAFTAAVAVVATGVAAVLSLGVQDQAAAQAAGDVHSLRGQTGILDTNVAPQVESQDTRQGSFERAYRQQPPLIPHSVEGYEITRDFNQCVQCHDWPFNVDQGAPKISETHYVNRDGVALDQVSSNRWFCTQCHVPQSKAEALVNNDFKSALDVVE